MAKHGKRYASTFAKIDRDKLYTLSDGIGLIKDAEACKFDEGVEMSVNLGVDPKHADQVVRGTVALPHGTGRKVRVVVINKGDKDEEAKEAGADHVGFTDLLDKIKGGWFDFDILICTPDVMAQVGKMGKVLGPRGLMPNPKSGTVTPNIAEAVEQVKAGRIEFRVDKGGVLHVAVGRQSFNKDALVENVQAFMAAVVRLRPTATKGTYVKKITLSTTMGPGLLLDTADVLAESK
jgi:large subunit ribosomal protein L1